MSTYVAIATTTIGSGGAADITFTSIPSSYTDLIIKLSARGSYSVQAYSMSMRFNSDTGNNYTTKALYGSGTTSGSETSSSISYIPVLINGNSSTASSFGSAEIYIPNYTKSKQKSSYTSAFSETNATGAYLYTTSNVWTGTSAITSITLNALSSYVFNQYSTATLYGIASS